MCHPQRISECRMHWIWCLLLLISLVALSATGANAVTTVRPRWRVLVLYENGGHHIAYSKRAKIWLDQLAANSGFDIDYIQKPDAIDDSMLSRYRLFIQLDYPPYGWPEKAVAAFERYISKRKGGWIGFHHASLLGEFDGFPMWEWFSRFMGDIRYVDYIPTFVQVTVNVENTRHP